MLHIVLLLSLFLATSNADIRDFCVADLKGAHSPAGYSCKPPQSVTVNDFVFSGLKPANASTPTGIAFTSATVQQLPGINGLGFSAARLDLAKGGTVPLHAHPDASELVIVVQGRLTCGFISSDNQVFVKTLSKGDVMVFPKGLLHFEMNVARGKSAALLIFSNTNPSAQILDLALFGSNFDSGLIQRTTFLDPAQVKKLKGIFGGSG